ncbi:hypothetical protein ACJX0J_012703, partial [Zea mays]
SMTGKCLQLHMEQNLLVHIVYNHLEYLAFLVLGKKKRWLVKNMNWTIGIGLCAVLFMYGLKMKTDLYNVKSNHH